MKNQPLKNWRAGSILLLALLISACSQPVQTTPVPIPLPAVPYLDIFPVYPGTSWTFERVDYESYLNQTVTATYQIIETVVDERVDLPYYIAHAKGEKTLLAKDAGWSQPDDSKSYEFWYVLRDGAVYKTQAAPDLVNLQNSSPEMVYQLPLMVGATWCPTSTGAQQGASCQNSGEFSVLGMQPIQTKSGILDGCYQIRQFFNDGSFFSLFCMMVGPAGVKFDHAGTPFGFNQTLTSFTRGPLPTGFTILPPTPVPTGQTVIKTCTLIGCGSAFVIKLSGAVPSNFNLLATGPDGVTAKAHCIDGQNSDPSDYTALPFQPVCSPDQVNFSGFSPQSVTIQVSWGSQSMTLETVPGYETLRPNGPECDPACRVGTVNLNFH